MFGSKQKETTTPIPEMKEEEIIMNDSAPQQQESTVSASTPNTNVVGPGITLNGDVDTLGNLLVEGIIKGDVKAESMMAISKTAEVEGNVKAKSAQISGKVTGEIDVQDILVLSSSAIVIGDITSSKLVVESGAQFNGSCTMMSNDAAAKMKAANAKAASATSTSLPTSPPPSSSSIKETASPAKPR